MEGVARNPSLRLLVVLGALRSDRAARAPAAAPVLLMIDRHGDRRGPDSLPLATVPRASLSEASERFFRQPVHISESSECGLGERRSQCPQPVPVAASAVGTEASPGRGGAAGTQLRGSVHRDARAARAARLWPGSPAFGPPNRESAVTGCRRRGHWLSNERSHWLSNERSEAVRSGPCQ